MIDLHRRHGGLPRRQKLRIICEDMLGLTVDDDEIQRLSIEYGRLADDAMMACPFTPGGQEFLQAYAPRYPLFIASGTPEDEMQRLVGRQGDELSSSQAYTARRGTRLPSFATSWQKTAGRPRGDALRWRFHRRLPGRSRRLRSIYRPRPRRQPQPLPPDSNAAGVKPGGASSTLGRRRPRHPILNKRAQFSPAINRFSSNGTPFRIRPTISRDRGNVDSAWG